MHKIVCECAPHQGLQNNKFTFTADKFRTILQAKNTQKLFQKIKIRF